MYRYVAIFIVALAVGFLTGWKTQGWRLGKEIATITTNYEKMQADAEEKARQVAAQYRAQEQRWVEQTAKAQEIRNVEVANINRKLTTALNSLRNRPERTAPAAGEVPSTAPACVGTTGAQLARGDAEFLAGYAADAAKLEAELNKCEAAYNALRTEEQ